jgi:hypothetical protein
VAINRLIADSEKDQTDEDREYREEYGDDTTGGATSHPIS